MGSDGDELEDISPHIRIRIDPRKKKEWLEYAQEHHYGNLTDLIKSAVDNTIDDKWVLEEKHQSDMDIDTSGLEEGIVDINDNLSIVEQKIDDLALQSGEETHTELSRDDLIKLANRCHDLLPRLQSEVQFPSLHQSFSIGLDNLPSDIDREIQSKSSADSIEWVRAKITGRAEDIANALEEPVHHVRHALIFLEQSETGSFVESVNDEGERRWFVRDPDASTDFSFLEDKQQDDSVGDLFPNQ